MTVQNKPNMNYGVWADNGNIEIPSSEKVEQGWVIEKPLNETMNWLQNRQDRMLQYINQRGIPEWDASTEYPIDSFVARGGVIYRALSQNQDADPTLNQDIWVIAFVTYTDFVDYSEKVNNIENTEGYLDLYVSKSFPVMTGAAKGVSYNESTGVSGLDFEGLTPKIVNEGLTVAEFSGGTNPKDVVTHEQLILAIQNYKVGDIYITTASGDPSERLGYGTWERFAEGETLVGFSTSVSNSTPEWVKIAGTKYGKYTHQLTVPELPSHSHDLSISRYSQIGHDSSEESDSTVDKIGTLGSGYIGSTGGNQPHENVQPSIVVFFWKRIS